MKFLLKGSLKRNYFGIPAKCFENLLHALEHRYIKKIFVKQRNSITKIDLIG